MNIPQKAINSLTVFGLNDLEAKIYIHLLKDHPKTGYQIARAINKPVANTYKALQAMENKGAVVVNDAKRRLCKPTPLNEFINQMELQFKKNKETAIKNLSEIEMHKDDEKVYEITNSDLFLQKAMKMINEAKCIVMADISPLFFKILKKNLAKAINRDVKIILKTYDSQKIKGVQVEIDPNSEKLLAASTGDFLRLIIDGGEYIMGYLTEECTNVYKAYWSKSPLLSQYEHFSVWTEIHIDRIGAALAEGKKLPALRKIYNSYEYGKLNPLAGTSKKTAI